MRFRRHDQDDFHSLAGIRPRSVLSEKVRDETGIPVGGTMQEPADESEFVAVPAKVMAVPPLPNPLVRRLSLPVSIPQESLGTLRDVTAC